MGSKILFQIKNQRSVVVDHSRVLHNKKEEQNHELVDISTQTLFTECPSRESSGKAQGDAAGLAARSTRAAEVRRMW